MRFASGLVLVGWMFAGCYDGDTSMDGPGFENFDLPDSGPDRTRGLEGGPTSCPSPSGCVPTPSTCGNGTAEPLEICWSTSLSLPLTAPALAAAVGDVDGDREVDLAVLSSAAELSLNVYRNLGARQFESSAQPLGALRGDRGPGSGLVLIDADSDGDFDAVFVSHAGNELGLSRNDGMGHFGAAVFVATSVAADQLQAHDLDGDGKTELIGVSRALAQVFTHSVAGGVIGPVQLLTLRGGLTASALGVGDLTGDGKVDLMVGGSESPLGAQTPGTLLLFEGDGAGGFRPHKEHAVVQRPLGLALADLDADGDLDIAMALQFHGFLETLRNLGGGTLGSPAGFGLGAVATQVFAEDLDGDADVDLAVSSSRGVLAFVNVATNAFVDSENFSSGVTPNNLLADLDGDLRPDLVTMPLAPFVFVLWSSQ